MRRSLLVKATATLMMLPFVPAVATDILDGLEFQHGIAFFHDLKYPADFTHLEYLNPDAPKGGLLVQATQSAVNTVAPLSGQGSPAGFWVHSETLIIRAGDELSAFYGRLADGIAVTDDRLTMVFRIHPDATWRDGVPITSKDVAYTFDTIRSLFSGRLWLDFIESVEEIDPRHVAIHLKSPLTLTNVIMVQFTSILPEHYWRDKDPTASTLVPPLSSGPYEIAAIKQGRFVEYRRDPAYWGRDIPVNKGSYNFDTVRYEVYRDATVIRESFRKGLIDIWTETDVRFWHNAYDIPALSKGWIKKIRRNFGIEVGFRRGIALNNRLDKFKDRRVRQALTLALDFEWQNRVLHYGYHKRAHSYWPDTALAATGLPSEDELALLKPYREQLPPEVFDRPFRFAEAASPEEHRASVIRARQLLEQAGWRVVDGTLINGAREPFEMTFLTRNPADARILLPYFRQLERLGIAADLRLVENTQYFNLRGKFEFDAVLKSHDIYMPPVLELKSTYHSDAAFVPMSDNVAGISHPALDYLITEANLATTLERMVATCRAIDRVLLWQYYQIPLHAVDLRRTLHWDKFGKPDFEPRYWPAFPEGWWYDPIRAGRIEITN